VERCVWNITRQEKLARRDNAKQTPWQKYAAKNITEADNAKETTEETTPRAKQPEGDTDNARMANNPKEDKLRERTTFTRPHLQKIRYLLRNNIMSENKEKWLIRNFQARSIPRE